MRVGESGLKEIYNETRVHRARRAAQRLVRVPEERLEELVGRYARQHRLEPKLVRAVIQAESGYNAAAVSVKGAMGLMQLMPGTARELGVDDPFDPEQNIRGGTSYLRQMLDRFEDNLVHALAGYNAGPEAVVRYGGVPPYAETRAYVQRIMRMNGDAGFTLPGVSAAAVRRGRPTYIARGADGRIVITTRRP
ncbi:MAG: lytic transglycosylase domain-containing protein [Thermoanaerobaculia bacterium]